MHSYVILPATLCCSMQHHGPVSPNLLTLTLRNPKLALTLVPVSVPKQHFVVPAHGKDSGTEHQTNCNSQRRVEDIVIHLYLSLEFNTK